MKQLKGAIQDVADRVNDPIVSDNISAIKAMIIIDRNIEEAIQVHEKRKEEISSQRVNENTIVTGEDIRNEMNREIGE